jgi:hypothetical protein
MLFVHFRGRSLPSAVPLSRPLTLPSGVCCKCFFHIRSFVLCVVDDVGIRIVAQQEDD